VQSSIMDLDPTYGWVIWHAAFPWTKEHKPQITTLSVTLMQEPVAMSGPQFRVSAPGEHIALTHPITGKQHMMTVLEYEQMEISCEHFSNQD